jgi:hypothetical protein
MKWIKKGQIFSPNGEYDWMESYTTPIAAIPFKDKIRVYFSSRSKIDPEGNFISFANFLDVERSKPLNILFLNNKPILDLGGVGMFDEFGTMVAKPVVQNDIIYLFYMGWQRLSNKTAPYQIMLGLCKSYDGGKTFEKVSSGPVLGIDVFDPISIGNVSVIIEDGKWRMWYTSYTRWNLVGQKPTPEYNIKYAESFDGVKWEKKNIICIEEDLDGSVATPSVIKFNKLYHMWFGYRPVVNLKGEIGGYRIGYASSKDGLTWIRDDSKAGINVSETGWDSEMICYPHVVKRDDSLIMFYCGNGFGATGFGYAELEINSV